MRNFLSLTVALAIGLTAPVLASSHKASYRPKTVPVRAYVKKSGTVVMPYRRATPER